MVIPWYVFLWVIIVFLIYVNVSEIVWRNIVSDCIILYCHQNVYNLPTSWFSCCHESVALALYFLLSSFSSLHSEIFLHLPPTLCWSLSISIHLTLICIRFIPLWVEWWSEVVTQGSFIDINGSSLLMPYRAAVSYGIWNTHTVDSPSTLIFFPCLNECNCCNFLPLINLLLLYYSRYNWCHNFNQLLTLSFWVKKVIEW